MNQQGICHMSRNNKTGSALGVDKNWDSYKFQGMAWGRSEGLFLHPDYLSHPLK